MTRSRPPNVVVVCVDTLRADLVDGALSFVRTPHLDRLRSESVGFSRCFGEGEPTIPVRRCLFTGRRSYPWREPVPNEGLQPAGLGWHAIPHQQPTLAERLHDAGWLPALVADTYHMFKPTMNFTRGFLSWQFIRGQEMDPWRSGPMEGIDLAAHVPEGEASPAKHPGVTQYLLNRQGWQREEDWLAARLFRTAARWLEDNRRNAPFFLWVDSFSPHELWDPPKEYADAYFAAPPGVKDYIHHGVVRGRMASLSEAQKERIKALYLGFVTFVDRWLGHFLAAMDRLRLWDETVVVFLSDHGTELLDRGRFGKSAASLYPYNTRLNWWVRLPDGPRGTTCDAWVQNQDFVPTLLGLLGVDHEALDGHDVWPLVEGRAGTVRDHVITGWGHHACVRDDRWALHLNASRGDGLHQARLYDLAADPGETEDVAARHPEAVAAAVAKLEALTGPLPASFHPYEQQVTARTMRTFARLRFGDG